MFSGAAGQAPGFGGLAGRNRPELKSISPIGKNLAILSAKNRYFVLYSVFFTVSQVHERFAFQ